MSTASSAEALLRANGLTIANGHTMRGTAAERERWIGMALPETGSYVVPSATSLLMLDRERDECV